MASPDPTADLLAHMVRRGLCPKMIHWNGEPQRFPGRDQTRGDNGWYVAFPDRRGAVYGDLREPGTQYKWQANGAKARHPDEIDAAGQAVRADFEEQRKRRKARMQKKQEAVAEQCNRIWKSADNRVSLKFTLSCSM